VAPDLTPQKGFKSELKEILFSVIVVFIREPFSIFQ